MLNKKRIAILMHERDDRRTFDKYTIARLAKHWQNDGHELVFLFGTTSFVPADILIVHVDLSVVPDEYLELARSYPVCVNGSIRDIRKSAVSSQLLSENAEWAGAVIVKTDENYGGVPERKRLGARPGGAGTAASAADTPKEMNEWFNYRIFASLRDVPAHVFQDKHLVVEKFRPEIEDGKYCVRWLICLGDQVFCARMRGWNPIVKAATVEDIEPSEAHPEVVAMAKALNCDYGKLDYVVVDGQPIVFDVNKTIGLIQEPVYEAELRLLANGLYAYL